MIRTAALILAAGKGSRMHSDTAKQFLMIGGKPLFLYSVEQYLSCVDQVVLVTSAEGRAFAEQALAGAGLSGRVPVTLGGKERFDSSYEGLRFLQELGDFTHVLIHDAARCLITEEVILRVLQDTVRYGAAVASVPLRDTIKISDSEGFAADTPDREGIYVIQTPQGFEMQLILDAFQRFYEAGAPHVTDDAMIVERFTSRKVRLSRGDENNIKVTTEADLPVVRGALSAEGGTETETAGRRNGKC